MGDYLMSLIKANDIQNASGGIPTVKGQKLIPTAWVNFNGTGTPAIRDSENVSSITDISAAKYQVNFAVTMPNANYAAIAMMGNTANASHDRMTATYNITTTSFSMIAYNLAGANYDQDYVAAVVMGGQS